MREETHLMAKQGQHNNDANDPDQSRGPNNPDKSVTITTGPPKNQETYEQQARQHEDPARPAQAARNEWDEDTRDEPDTTGGTRAREVRSGRSGSDSNADKGTQG
jgi:hypothetical protein